tara:strand:- start:106291 stop:106845 length:555 start_codon:yes stop_codon:yes gene_type:complete
VNFESILEKTRTYHNFEETNVNESFIHDLIRNALKAPNHKYTFPWKYLWLKGEAKEKVANLFYESKKHKADPELGRDENFFKSKILLPEVIVLVQEKADDAFTLKEDYATLSCSVQIMAMHLRANDMGYKWSTGGATRDPKVYKILGLNPEKDEIIGFLLFGKSKNTPPERRRPSVKDVLITTT